MKCALAIALMLAATAANASLDTPVDMNRVKAMIPAAIPTCAAAPAADTLMGSAGTAEPCAPREDASRATIIQAVTVVTGVDARYSVTFERAFASTPIYVDARVVGANQPFLCTVETYNTTSASGKCFQLVATTLPVVSTSLLGLVVSPFASAAAGLTVKVVARQ